jgi:hypothetical protein
VLSREDLHVLKIPLAREVQRHLPVPASVHFYCSHESADDETLAGSASPVESRDLVPLG